MESQLWNERPPFFPYVKGEKWPQVPATTAPESCSNCFNCPLLMRIMKRLSLNLRELQLRTGHELTEPQVLRFKDLLLSALHVVQSTRHNSVDQDFLVPQWIPLGTESHYCAHSWHSTPPSMAGKGERYINSSKRLSAHKRRQDKTMRNNFEPNFLSLRISFAWQCLQSTLSVGTQRQTPRTKKRKERPNTITTFFLSERYQTLKHFSS